jgi:hypothetical protein
MKIRSGGRLMLLLKEREETEEGDEKIIMLIGRIVFGIQFGTEYETKFLTWNLFYFNIKKNKLS